MTHCLICQRPEGRAAAPFICSACVQALARSSSEALMSRYVKAVKAKEWGVAYALYTFVPRRVRKKYPLPKSIRKLVTQDTCKWKKKTARFKPCAS